jgi:hypothetical protein
MSVIPPDVDLFKVTWSGTLGSTEEEIFSHHRVCYAAADTPPIDVATALQDDITDMLAESTTGSTPFSNLGQIFPTTVLWTLLKAVHINRTTGEDVGDSASVVLTDAGLGASGQGLPYQDALAITVQSDPPDRARRNRWYLPPMVSTATDGHGRVLPTLIDDIQTVLRFTQLAHNVDTLPVHYCIFSKTLGAFEIERYYTGDVMDTIRRRRNKLPEVRHILDV